MAKEGVLAVIPARWGSTRFPGKALAELAGRPLVEHVWRRARAARLPDRVIVATDDQRILEAVEAFGGEARLTSPEHASGSDRAAEVAASGDWSVVVNIQGDEPLLDPQDLDRAIAPLQAPDPPDVCTLAAPLPASRDAADPHVVKVVTAANGDALYFSRAAIPFRRHQGAAPVLQHMGLYAFRREVLLEFTRWPVSPLEQVEGLEQLRLLEHGRRLRVVVVAQAHPGIDTPDDLARASRLMKAESA